LFRDNRGLRFSASASVGAFFTFWGDFMFKTMLKRINLENIGSFILDGAEVT